MTLGAKLYLARSSKNWSMHQLADKASIAVELIRKIEESAITENSLFLRQAKKIADALGVSLDELCSD